MSGYAGGYAILQIPSVPGSQTTEAPDNAVIYWDASANILKGSYDLVFDETLKTLTLGGGLAGATGQFLAADGTLTRPAYSFADRVTLGFYRYSTTEFAVVGANSVGAIFSGTGIGIPATAQLAFGDSTAILTSPATGVLSLSTGSAMYFPDGTTAVPAIAFKDSTGSGFWRAASIVGASINGVEKLRLTNGDLNIQGNSYSFQFDTYISRDAANVVAQRNGTNAQAFRVYNTYTDASNYERGRLEWSGNILYIGSQAAGTGTARATAIHSAQNVLFYSDGVNNSYLTSGAFYPHNDAGPTLGLSSQRWEGLFVGGVAATVPITVKLHASQTANALEVQNSSGTPLSRIKSDGRWRHDGATTWDDLRVEPVARTTGANAPSFEKWLDDVGGTSRGVYLYSFDDAAGGSEKEIMFTMQMPHNWKLGTNIHLHVHWIGNVADTTADPRWGLEYAFKDIGEVFGDTTIIYSDGTHTDGTSNDANITALKHYITEFADIVPGTTADNVSAILIGRVFRDSANAADTYDAATNKCGLLYIDAHYEIDSFGSDSEYVKGT